MSTQHLDSRNRTVLTPFWLQTDWLIIGLITLASAVVLWRLWQPGIPNTGDMLMSVYRVYELANAWREGIFYPRLGPDLNFGYGAPLFQFYPPLASYVALLFHGLGLELIAATKATATLGILLAVLGMYLYARLFFVNRWASLVSAICYGLAPYLLLNVYERGAVAEGLALTLLPWLFWAMRRLLYQGQALDWGLASGLVAALMLAHNITALWAIPTAGGYFVALALYERRYMGVLRVAAALGLGLALSAFYWLPALVEIKFTHTTVFMLQNPTKFLEAMVAWPALLQPTLFFEYQGPFRFRFSLAQAVIGLLGLLALPWCKPRLRVELAVLALITLAVLGLQLDNTLGIWQNVPLMRFVQFPWRLFGLATFCTALLVGASFTWERLRAWTAGALAVTLCTLWLGVALPNLKPELLPFWAPISEADINQLDLYTRGATGFPLFSDYSPQSMQLDSKGFTLSRLAGFPPLPPLPAAPAMQVLRENSVFAELEVTAPAPFPLRFSRVFFPGWQVYQNDQPVPTYGSGTFGLVTADLPAGNYRVRIAFDQTPLRRAADWLSLAALAVWLMGWPPRSWRLGALALVALLGIVFYQQTRTPWGHQPTPYAVNFQDKVHLLGYELPKTTWRASEPISLRLYWLAQETPPTNYKIFLHLARLDDSGQVAQADSEPQLSFTPMTTWEAGNVVVDPHLFRSENPIPSGRYRLLLGLYQPEPLQNLLVRSAPNVLPGDRVILTEVDIVDE